MSELNDQGWLCCCLCLSGATLALPLIGANLALTLVGANLALPLVGAILALALPLVGATLALALPLVGATLHPRDDSRLHSFEIRSLMSSKFCRTRFQSTSVCQDTGVIVRLRTPPPPAPPASQAF